MKTTKSKGNIFADIGFDEIEAEQLAVKSDLITLLDKAIRQQKLTQAEAARRCGTDQPTLNKALNGNLTSVTIDRLAKWNAALGGRITIEVNQPKKRGRRKGSIAVSAT